MKGRPALQRPPAAGERDAVRGFQWQYDHIAAQVYDGLVDDTFVSLRLTDPEAGRVDDLVLESINGTAGYQYKSARHPESLTFNRLLAAGRTAAGNHAPSLLHSLADGWQRLATRHGGATVHLVTADHASTSDRIAADVTNDRPSPDHFSCFLSDVLMPLRAGELIRATVRAGWQPALTRLLAESGVPEGDQDQFLRGLHIETSAQTPLRYAHGIRERDIRQLSNVLFRAVAEANDVVVLDRASVLALVGWTARPQHQSRHEFPVDLDTYQPLTSAIEQVNQLLGLHDRGYIALIGPPGAGKSTLLSQALSGRSDRVARYYAYIPGAAGSRTRMAARSFLHDLVVMLTRLGLRTAQKELPGDDIDQLRRHFNELLDAAHQDFIDHGRRTILVVDGLDHVERDYTGPDRFLEELPAPNELPDGIILIVGSRTLNALRAPARSQVAERDSAVDLQHHRLSRSSVIELCRRAPITAALDHTVHDRIAALSNGHPLALSYLLNRLKGAEPATANAMLDEAPQYDGDIAAEYLAVWDTLDSEYEVRRLLGACARLRTGFELAWFETWASAAAMDLFRRRLLYLFRRHLDGWRFFHDSFQQFAAEHTALDEFGRFDADADGRMHAQVADLYAQSTTQLVRDEELYHRHLSGDTNATLALATPAIFREQHARLRAPELIRADISLALRAAAERADVLGIIRLLFAMVEFSQRVSVLEDIDMPGALFNAGLIDEAVGYCGVETRRVPLANAYNLAARLAQDASLAGHVLAGRLIFDQIEPDGLDDPDHRLAGTEDDAARAWGGAAPHYRPLGDVLATVERLRTARDADRYGRGHGRHLTRYRRVMNAVIRSVAAMNDPSLLVEVQTALAGTLTGLQGQEAAAGQGASARAETGPMNDPKTDSDAGFDSADDGGETRDGDTEEVDSGDGHMDEGDSELDAHIATVALLLARTVFARIRRTDRPVDQSLLLNELLDTIDDSPLYIETLLDLAEATLRDGQPDVASKAADRANLSNALAVSDLGFDTPSDALRNNFRYWRLRELIAKEDGETEFVAHSTPPQKGTPAGNHITPSAPVHSNHEAIELAARINDAIQTLAHIDAASETDDPIPVHDAWTSMVPILSVIRNVSIRTSATVSGIAQHRGALLRLVIEVAGNHSDGLASTLADMLHARIINDPDSWPTKLQIELARELRRIGITAPWYDNALATEEQSAAESDLYSRIEDTAELIRLYASDSRMDDAKRLANAMVPMSLGVGYRKDYQFDNWVRWLGLAINEPDTHTPVTDAAWLARVMHVVAPMTEGAPATAAAELPAVVATADPEASVRLLAYLVGTGTVDHTATLASLIAALTTTLDAPDADAVYLAADLTSEIVIPASRVSHPELAHALVAAADRCLDDRTRTAFLDSVEAAIHIRALPTTREQWLQALGRPTPPPSNPETPSATGPGRDVGYGELRLTDGRTISRQHVPTIATTPADIAELRRLESPESAFRWLPVLEPHSFTRAQLAELAPLFTDRTPFDGEPVASLAEQALRLGDTELALTLARTAREGTRPEAWSRNYESARRRAASVTVRAGGEAELIEACEDLAEQIIESKWLASMLVNELDDLIETLAPHTPAHTIWPYIRDHLQAFTTFLQMPDDNPLGDRGTHWWTRTDTQSDTQPEPRPASAEPLTSASRALSQLAVLHLSHPTWLAREGAVRALASALTRNNSTAADELSKFGTAQTLSDDLLEQIGRTMTIARAMGATLPAQLDSVDDTLANHANQLVRDLSQPAPSDRSALAGALLPSAAAPGQAARAKTHHARSI